MIRRLKLAWPSARTRRPGGRGIRLLAVSDERVRSLDHPANRQALEPIDAIVACGDLEPDYLCFLADAFRSPLLYVRGNHDRGDPWSAGRAALPRPLDGRVEEIAGISVIGLSWPGPRRGRAVRDEVDAWRQALAAGWRAWLRSGRPYLVLSHVPPSGLGDSPADAFHRGFAAYRWLCRTLRPPLWLHGHTTTAAAEAWRTTWGPTTLVNVTGAVLIELDEHAAKHAADQVAQGEPAADTHDGRAAAARYHRPASSTGGA